MEKTRRVSKGTPPRDARRIIELTPAFTAPSVHDFDRGAVAEISRGSQTPGIGIASNSTLEGSQRPPGSRGRTVDARRCRRRRSPRSQSQDTSRARHKAARIEL